MCFKDATFLTVNFRFSDRVQKNYLRINPLFFWELSPKGEGIKSDDTLMTRIKARKSISHFATF